ncbi:MAG: M23 family metallopeptidase [Clostridia bacterium]|nr:M23 family metallopeptidase [Clostridia bacterium]
MKKERKSLYIGVALFLAGIIVSGVVSDFVMKNTAENSKNVTDTEEIVSTVYESAYEKEEKAVEPVSNEVLVEEPEQAEEPFSFIAPVSGEVLIPYSGDKLVFSKTLQDYRGHSGTDVKAASLEKVLAAEKGVVKETRDDSLLGITIVIDHENGFESVYSNLSTENMVEVGEKVEKGMIISGVGNTAISESEEEPHLHFELYKDGKAVNPEEYISF